MRLARPLALFVPVCLLSGCATLFSSGANQVSLQSDSQGADVYVNGSLRGKTPLQLTLDNTKPVTVTFKMAGRQDQTVEIGTKVRAGFVVLDVLGGLLPVIIDAASGEWKTLDTKTVNVTLAPTTAGSGTK